MIVVTKTDENQLIYSHGISVFTFNLLFISSECLSNCSALTTNGSTSSSSIPNFFINPYLSYSCPLKTFFLTIIFYLLMTYYQIFDKRNTTGATSGAGTSYPSVAPEFTTIFCGGHVTQSLVVFAVFCRSLFFFVIFLLTNALSALQFTASNYPLAIFKQFGQTCFSVRWVKLTQWQHFMFCFHCGDYLTLCRLQIVNIVKKREKGGRVSIFFKGR